jgi:hypothetical protein
VIVDEFKDSDKARGFAEELARIDRLAAPDPMLT